MHGFCHCNIMHGMCQFPSTDGRPLVDLDQAAKCTRLAGHLVHFAQEKYMRATIVYVQTYKLLLYKTTMRMALISFKSMFFGFGCSVLVRRSVPARQCATVALTCLNLVMVLLQLVAKSKSVPYLNCGMKGKLY